MQLTRNLAGALGKPRGYAITWQAVVDGIKLTPKSPHFVLARDAILRALRALRDSGRLLPDEYVEVRRAGWEAFARFGLGANAACPNASFRGCQGDTSVPQDEDEV